MALPTAQLGQLAGINMPYQVPTHERTRGRDKVLTALATALAMKGLENVTSRDFAAQPAGFWSKLVQGPQESREQFDKRMAQTAETERSAADRAARERMLGVEIESRNSAESRRAADAAAQRQLEWELANTRGQQQLDLATLAQGHERELAQGRFQNELAAIDRQGEITGRLQSQARNEQAITQYMLGEQKLASDLAVVREAAAVEGNTPRGRLLDAQARQIEAELEMYRGRLPGAAGGPKSNDRAAIQRQVQSETAMQDMSTAPIPEQGYYMTPEDYLRAGITPEQAKVRQAREQAVQQRVNVDQPASARRKELSENARLMELRRQLGLTPLPPASPYGASFPY